MAHGGTSTCTLVQTLEWSIPSRLFHLVLLHFLSGHRGMQKWPVHSYSHMLLPFSLLAGQRPFCVRPRSLLGKAVVLFHLSGRGVSQVEPGVTLMSEQDGVACFPASTVTDILSPNEEMKPSPWCVGKALECKDWRGRVFSDPLCGYEISPGHRSTPP